MKLAFFGILAILGVVLCAPSSSNGLSLPAVNKGSEVNVEIYYESYCPDCQEFISGELKRTWNVLSSSGIMNIHMFPYGNANFTANSDGSYNFTCQHGPKECLGNTYEACIIASAIYDPYKYLPVIMCMEGSADPVDAAEKCVNTLFKKTATFEEVKKCALGRAGNLDEHVAGVMTDRLKPKHKYVPWIRINQVHTEELQKRAMTDLVKVVCDAYRGLGGVRAPGPCMHKEDSTKDQDNLIKDHGLSLAAVNTGTVVNVGLYYESYCPDCQQFISGELKRTWDVLSPTGIMRLHLFPYGNANSTSNSDGSYNFTCQHGPKECLGNTYEACIITSSFYDPYKYLPVIMCMEGSPDPVDAAEKCINNFFKKTATFEEVKKCALGRAGNFDEHVSGLMTDRLKPKHTYVPWITINQVHTEEIQKRAETDLVKVVCEAYIGLGGVRAPGPCMHKEDLSKDQDDIKDKTEDVVIHVV